MRRFLLRSFLTLAIFAGPAFGQDPVAFHPGIGEGVPAEGGRDVLWSQPGLLGGDKVSSEIIDMFGLVSEVAGDFLLDCDGPVTITTVTWWGGQWGWLIGDPVCTEFNLILYEEDPDPDTCLPVVEPFALYLNVTPQQTDLGGDPDHYETNFRYDMPLEIGLSGGVRYWIVAQAADHPFPGQWGRTEAVDRQGCVSYFRSPYFGPEEWPPTEDAIGSPYTDASVELSGYCGGVAIRRSTWGAIRGLYR